jgi:short-subunit dehydrogenase
MKDKVCIITGASSGIGKALAYEYASRGHRISISARRKDILRSVADDIKSKFAVDVLAITADVSKEEDCKSIIDQTIEQFGQIDILINNAGISQRALLKDLPIDSLREVMGINYWGTVYCTKFALEHLLKTKGSVVAVSSISGFSPLPARTAYCSSKYAVHGFLESLRVENMETGLHVMIAAPEYTSTEIRKHAIVAGGEKQGESPRDEHDMLTPEFVAYRIAKGVSKRRRTLVIGKMGTLTVIVTRLFPKLSDRLIYNYIKKEANSPF